MITEKDIVFISLDIHEFDECIMNAKSVCFHIKDRADLHERDLLERFNNILMGEVAEKMVIKWLNSNGKFASSSVDKLSKKPDHGHDILLKKNDSHVYCSVKSSLSALKDIQYIIENFKLATKKNELTTVNIQVYFWLSINPKEFGAPRLTVPSLKQAAIIGWFGQNDIKNFTTYNRENRESPSVELKHSRPMISLLDYIT
ncbi:hypothetical protein H5A40_13375 [Pectobacterium brasiliense]|uniref:hypothetical protein n=1 Tax=Pectobacterium brasiliense TaxID=180957 RepID=UPI001968B4D6|nr:hypothetical protein [Pectobacterium brasiliense]QSD34079.1 hypothetical protein H5A40_13375 [Pectobacterium brasiliense]